MLFYFRVYDVAECLRLCSTINRLLDTVDDSFLAIERIGIAIETASYYS